jgi:transposase
MEACGGAHHWAREIAKLGHTVKMMNPKMDSVSVCRSAHLPRNALVRGTE